MTQFSLRVVLALAPATRPDFAGGEVADRAGCVLNVPELQQPDLLTDRLPLLFREMGQLRSENVPTYKPTVNRLRTTLSSGLIFVRVFFMFSQVHTRGQRCQTSTTSE